MEIRVGMRFVAHDAPGAIYEITNTDYFVFYSLIDARNAPVSVGSRTFHDAKANFDTGYWILQDPIDILIQEADND